MNCIVYYQPQDGTVPLTKHVKIKMLMCMCQREWEREVLCVKWSSFCLAAFFTAGVASAHSSKEPDCVAAACPGASPSITVGPGRQARPVTFLIKSRSCTCKTLSKLTHKRESDMTGLVGMFGYCVF